MLRDSGFFSASDGLGMTTLTGRMEEARSGLLFSKLPSLLLAFELCERETLLLRRKREFSTFKMPVLWVE